MKISLLTIVHETRTVL